MYIIFCIYIYIYVIFLNIYIYIIRFGRNRNIACREINVLYKAYIYNIYINTYITWFYHKKNQMNPNCAI